MKFVSALFSKLDNENQQLDVRAMSRRGFLVSLLAIPFVARWLKTLRSESSVSAKGLESLAAAMTEQQSFIIESFRGQIYISNELDVQDTPIYDTDTYTAGQTINQQNSAFFSNVESPNSFEVRIHSDGRRSRAQPWFASRPT